MKKLITFITLFTFLMTTLFLPTTSAQVFAAENIDSTVTNAIQWIGANQNADGSWGLSQQQKMLDTPIILEVLSKYGYLTEKQPIGINWLQANPPVDNNYLTKYLSVPNMVSAVSITELLNTQSSYGGWGNGVGSSCNNQVTASALKVLLDIDDYDQQVITGAFHLISTQNADGSWGLTKDEAGSIYITGLVRDVLYRFQQKTRYDLDIELEKAATWLLSKKNSDGNWGRIDLTCMAYKGLQYDKWSDVKDVPQYLSDLQLSNGSWDNDPYTTILALEVVLKDRIEDIPSIKDIRLIYESKDSLSFEANSEFEVVTEYTGHNVTSEINLINPVGDNIALVSSEGRFYWDTGLNRCGSYTVEVIIKDNAGQIVASQTKNFELEPYLDISESYVEATPGAALVDMPLTPTTSLYINCETNIYDQIDIERKVFDDNNAEVDVKSASIILSQGENIVDLGSFSADTANEKSYVIHADIVHNGVVMMDGEACLRILEEINSFYTSNIDFDRGVLKGVNYDEVSDQIQLNKNAAVFPYIWIANAGEGTVSKIDTRTGKEIGRYKTALATSISPSRTCVDKDGNCWVANRLNGTVVKISMNSGVDKNNNGIIDTSTDLNENGYIDSNEILPWGEDEAVLAVVAVGSGPNSLPRAMAIDKNNRIWIGLYNDKKYVIIDPETLKLTNIEVETPNGPYGATIDSSGYLWSSTIHAAKIEKIDTNNPRFIKSYPVGSAVYGIVVDKNGVVWAGGYSTSGPLIRFDSSTEKYTHHDGNGKYGRGVAVDDGGNVWVAYSGNNWVSKFDSNGKYLLSINIGAKGGTSPIGVGVDGEGYVWVTCRGTNNTFKIDSSGNIEGIYRTGKYPYSYSDMTGYNLQNFTAHEGTWTVTHDGEYMSNIWEQINWSSEEPQNTAVDVKARAGNTPQELKDATYLNVSQGQALQNITGRFMQVEVKLSTSDTDSPILKDIEIKGKNVKPVADAGENQNIKLIVGDTGRVTLNASNSFDPTGGGLTYRWTWDGKSIPGVRPRIVLPLGTTEITLVAKNDYTESEPSKVYVTVADANGITTVPEKPIGINKVVNSTSITLSWDSLIGAYGYDLEIDGEVVEKLKVKEYNHLQLNPETNHKYRLRGRNSKGVGEWSDLISLSTISATQEIAQALTQLENATGVQSINIMATTLRNSNSSLASIDTLEAVDEAKQELEYLTGLLNFVSGSSEKEALLSRINDVDEKLNITNVTEKIQVLEELKEDISLSEPIENAISEINEQIELLPESEIKEDFVEKTEQIKKDVESTQVVVKIGILEAMAISLELQELIDQAQVYLDSIQQDINEYPEDDIKPVLQSRVDAVQLQINIAQTELMTSIAEETILSEDVNEAQECNFILPDGEIKNNFQSRINFMFDVIETTEETNILQNSFEDFEKILKTSDITSKQQIEELETVYSKVYMQSNKVIELLGALPNTEKENLAMRIVELGEIFKPIPGFMNSIESLLEDAHENYKSKNGNSEFRIKVQKDSTINLLDVENELIQDKLKSIENLRWISINKNLVTVDDNGNLTALKNGVAKVVVYNDNDKVDLYMVISNGELGELDNQNDESIHVKGKNK